MGSQRKTKKQFIDEAISVHGGKYDYSKVEYINNKVKVCIICASHGEFYQSPISHLRGSGCPKCGAKSKKLLCGVGISDVEGSYNTDAYNYWSRMIKRCYYNDKKRISNSYSDCYVCNEWLRFSNFKKWFDNEYISGFELDKDILIKNNKVYSPATCCFLPRGLNALLTKRQSCRGCLPIGVSFSKSNDRPYRAYLMDGGKQIWLGHYTTKEDAFAAYKHAKEDRIKRLALRYKNAIRTDVYIALCNYKVDIND